MKKIFGVLSLIAIMTVVFATSANAIDDNNSNVEFVMDMGSPDLAPSVLAIVPTLEGLLFSRTIDVTNSLTSNIDGDANEVATIEPILTPSNFEYGLIASIDNELTTGLNEPLPDLTKYVNEYNEHFVSTNLIDGIATNVGKFTKLTFTF